MELTLEPRASTSIFQGPGAPKAGTPPQRTAQDPAIPILGELENFLVPCNGESLKLPRSSAGTTLELFLT